MTESFTDRIALSHWLLELAESFMEEGERWALAQQKEECFRVSRTLAEIARHAARGNADHLKAEAYAMGAERILSNLVAARRFFTAILTPPTRGADHA